MTRSQAIEHFRSVSALARALGISKAAVFAWGETIPELRQHQLEKLTGGKLKAAGPAAAVHIDHPDLMQATQDLLLAVSNFHRTLGAAAAAAAGMAAGAGASAPPGQSVA